MNTEELLVHNGCQGETVKGVHTRIINSFSVLDLAWGRAVQVQYIHVSNLTKKPSY